MMICQFSGCAKTTSTATTSTANSPPAPVAPISDVEALPAQKTQSELRVGADPYYSNKQKEMFGEDLSRTGLLPIMVYLLNKGEQPLKVNPNLISLEFQAGGEVKPSSLPSALLPEPHLSDTTGAKVGRVVAGIAAIAAVFIVPGGGAILTEDIARRLANKPKLRKEYPGKELREVTLAKGESAQGFVYFYLPQGIQ
jgi:hypothetical protein